MKQLLFSIRCTGIILFLGFFLFSFSQAQSQLQPGFSYQAVARDNAGNPMPSKFLVVRIAIRAGSETGQLIWQEDHNVLTNQFGLFDLVVGGQGGYGYTGSVDAFSDIDWSADQYYINLHVKQDNEFINMGGSPIRTVPVAQFAQTAKNAAGSFSVQADKVPDDGEALFEVKRSDGSVAFAVYEDSVRVYFNTDETKGVKGGFAVGGYTGQGTKGPVEDYLRVTPDSVRVYVRKNDSKGVKGGFAVGGYSGQGTKAPVEEFLLITPDSVRVYGSGSEDERLKNIAIGQGSYAMGQYSAAIGYYARAVNNGAFAIGDHAVASGLKSVSLGSYSTASASNSVAIGNNTTSSNTNSISIGNETQASGTHSTSLGYRSIASGLRSSSIGTYYYKSLNFIRILYPPIWFPIGKGDAEEFISKETESSSKGSFVSLPLYANRNNQAIGEYSLAVGNGNLSENGGLSFGVYNTASAIYATALGFANQAVAPYSFAGGFANRTEGEFATAFGRYTSAASANSFVIGTYNVSSGSPDEWVNTDPLFQIGNGSSSTNTHDAFRVLKNGGTYINAEDNIGGLWVTTTSTARTATNYGILSRVVRNNTSATYYSGYFYNTGSGGYYNGLYADKRAGAAIDVAEYIYDTHGNTEAGDVLVADRDQKESVVLSDSPYQTTVLGIVTTKPHMVMGIDLVMDEKGEPLPDVKATRLTLSGRVPCKVSGENGPIRPGDLLTSSSTPGHAMKWTLLDVSEAKDFEELKAMLAENEKRRNAVIGKAVESFDGGTGKIMVLVALQ